MPERRENGGARGRARDLPTGHPEASGGDGVLRLLLVEDHAAFRGALALLLNLRPGMRVVAQCGSLAGCRALGGLLSTVDVALVDLFLPDGEGTEFIAILRGANPSVRVLVLTASLEPGLQGRMAEAGADGVLDKTAALSEIASEVARLGTGRGG